MHPYDHADATFPAYEPGDARPPRRNRRPVVIAVGALLALLLVPVTVDRFARTRVESRTAEAFQEGMHTTAAPQVHVRGFPVLTQLASGTLRQVDITAHDIPASDATGPLPVTELSLRLTELRKSDDDTEALARSAQATALLSYPDLSGNRMAFKDFQVTGGPLPGVGGAALGQVFAQPIQLRNIPQGLRLRSVTATESGLVARLTGESVTFRSADGSRNGGAQVNSPYGKGV